MRFLGSLGSWDRVPVHVRSAAPLVVIAAWSLIGVFRDIGDFLSLNSPVGFLWS